MQWHPAATSFAVTRHVECIRQKNSGWRRRAWRHRASDTALGAYHEFVARQALVGQHLQRGADVALAALKAIVDRRVKHIESRESGFNQRSRITRIGAVRGWQRYVPTPSEETVSPCAFRKCPSAAISLNFARTVPCRPALHPGSS